MGMGGRVSGASYLHVKAPFYIFNADTPCPMILGYVNAYRLPLKIPRVFFEAVGAAITRGWVSSFRSDPCPAYGRRGGKV